MASSLFGGVQKPNPVQSAMQAVNMMRYGSNYLSNSVKHLSHT